MKKKTISIMLMMIVCIAMLTTVVRAEEPACRIDLTPSKNELKEGDILELSINMLDIKETRGIAGILAALEYDKEIFELQYIEDNDIRETIKNTEFKDAKILYSGKEFIDNTEKGAWYVLSIKDGIYGNVIADPQKKDVEIATIKFKVKSGIKEGTTSISIVEPEVFSPEDISTNNGAKGKKIATARTSVKIVSNSGEQTQNNNVTTNNNNNNNVNTNINTNTTTNNNSSTNTNSQSNKQPNKNIPYTGAQDFIPFIVLVSVIGIVSYIKYNNYKDI